MNDQHEFIFDDYWQHIQSFTSNPMIAVTNFEADVAAWTIRGALICMVLFFAMRISNRKLQGTTLELAKSAWLIGSLLSLLHGLATMAYYHQFQHALAYQDTAQQTEQAIGVAVGIGIWLNYLFIIVWILDALWMNGLAKGYFSRLRAFNWMIYGFLGFIAFNGAIVFESGPVRWVGILAILVLVVIWKTRDRSRSGPRSRH